MKGGLLGRLRTITEDTRNRCERLVSRKKTTGSAYTVRVISYTTDTVRERTKKTEAHDAVWFIFQSKNRHKW